MREIELEAGSSPRGGGIPLEDCRSELLGLVPATLMLERLPLPALVIDVVGEIVLANDALESLLNYACGSLVGRPVEALAPGLLGGSALVVDRLSSLTDRIILVVDDAGERRYVRISASVALGYERCFSVMILEDVDELRWRDEMPSTSRRRH